MARPRKYDDRAHSSFRCPRDLLDDAQRSAAERDISFNLWLERAIRSYLTSIGAPSREVSPEPPWSWRDEGRSEP